MTLEPLPDYPFRRMTHDRLAERRDDQEFLDRAWADPATQVLVMRGAELPTNGAGDALRFTAPTEAPEGPRMLLGAVDEVTVFLVLADGESAARDGEYAELRAVATAMNDVHASLAVHAVSLANWHLHHPRCSVCGAETDIVRAGEARRCPNCSAMHFPRTDPAVIMLVVDDEDRALLGHNAARRTTWFSTLAGFVEPGESPEHAVAREVAEETGVVVDDVTYLGSQPWPFPSSLMLGYVAHAATTAIVVDDEEITEARWFTRADVKREVEDGSLILPTTISIAGALIARWYGGELPENRL